MENPREEIHIFFFSFFLNMIENTVHVHNATTNPQSSSSNTMQKRPNTIKPTKYAKEQA